MLNDQLSLFEKLIWSVYGIYSRNPIPKNDEKKSSNDLFGAKRVLSFLGK